METLFDKKVLHKNKKRKEKETIFVPYVSDRWLNCQNHPQLYRLIYANKSNTYGWTSTSKATAVFFDES